MTSSFRRSPCVKASASGTGACLRRVLRLRWARRQGDCAAVCRALNGSVLCTYYSAPLHSKPGHPEGPARVEAIVERLRANVSPKAGQPAVEAASPAAQFWSQQVQLLESRRTATPAELALVHPPTYVAAIRAACEKLKEPTLVDDSTYLAPGSYEDCSRSVGAALDALDGLFRAGDQAGGSADSAFALVRPPGHHVLPRRPMGFGVFNTVALTARYARERYGIGKIAIVDFDVHHGNGTMEVFYDDPLTQYISTHQAGLWPYTGKAREIGSGAGRGTTLNVPLPGGSGDKAMRLVWDQLVLPAIDSFRPELLLVSAGYDAHWRDPLAALQLTPATYQWLMLVLEGGYDTTSLSESVVASLEGLLGLPATSVPPPSARDLYEEPLHKVERVLQEVHLALGM